MNPNSSRESIRFVVDGRDRALDAAANELATRRVEVVARIRLTYESRMADAGLVGRFLLRIQMTWDIRREMRREKEAVAPRGALYARN